MIVLDTHVWLWWVQDPGRLPRRAAQEIRRNERSQSIRVSVASVWEVAIKVSKGKLALDRDIEQWAEAASLYPGIRILPVTAQDAIGSTLLPAGISDDPFDRLIVAVTRRLGATLVTLDDNLRRYPHVQTLA